uniref:Uncharacterized protein n=1 Tax=Tanacetum cinerariifolium TaxID=118510 RepID=A0A699T1E3_TANCI|nr:hypothetical protein [Tanacetum cinerariifolium]
MALPEAGCTPNGPVLWPVNSSRATTLSLASTRSSRVHFRSGTAVRKPLEAACRPGSPWGRPGGKVLSLKSGLTAARA